MIVALSVVGACVDDVAGPPANVAWDSAGVRVVHSTRAEYADSLGWTVDPNPVLDLADPVDGPAHVFHRVSDIMRLPDSSIVVAELGSALVRRFSTDGAMVHSAGARGDGPGEYRQLSEIHQYLGDSLVAFDRWLGRATVLDDDLKLGRTIQFLAPYAGRLNVLQDGTFLVQFVYPSVIDYEGPGGLARVPVPSVRYTADGVLADTFLILPGDEELMIPSRSGEGWSATAVLFPRRSFVVSHGSRVFLATSDSLSFDVHSSDGALLQRQWVPTWDPSVTSEMIEAEKWAFVPDDATPAMLQAVEDRHAMQPTRTSRPAFEALLVDRAGHVWLAATKGRANYYGETSWEVFAPTGEWLGTVDTPARFTVHEIGVREIIGVWTDDLDVEHVQVLRLNRGRGG